MFSTSLMEVNRTCSHYCLWHFADVNECETGNNCHPNATCTDTHGSYVCTCNDGNAGDGFICEGECRYMLGQLYFLYNFLQRSNQVIRIDCMYIAITTQINTTQTLCLSITAQCLTNFQLVLKPVDSCLNWRVSWNPFPHDYSKHIAS